MNSYIWSVRSSLGKVVECWSIPLLENQKFEYYEIQSPEGIVKIPFNEITKLQEQP